MRKTQMLAAVLVLLAAAPAMAADPTGAPVDESVYAPYTATPESEWTNTGGVNIDLDIRYLTDYVFRGIDHSEVGGHEDAPNLQVDQKLSFDLGKAPHPFVGIFANVYDSDPVSQFQEVRPYVGAEWTLRQLTVAAGQTTFIFPERESSNTAEVWGRISLDDSILFGTSQPILSPYVFGAYDYDLNKGWYFEAGVSHTFEIPETGLSLKFIADLAYVSSYPEAASPFPLTSTTVPVDTGFHHYDLGLIGSYSLNMLLNIPKRYGEWELQGYLYYTDGIRDQLHTDTQLYGGAGFSFHY